MISLLIISMLLGIALLYFSSEIVVEKLITLARYIGISTFFIGFVVSSIGSDLPEIVNGLYSASIEHADIAFGNSIGSANSQLLLVLGLIPLFCTFCRLLPKPFAIVGYFEVFILVIVVLLSYDGLVSRFDALVLLMSWLISIVLIRRFGGERYSEDESELLKLESINKSWTALGIVIGFIGIAFGSYLVVEAIIDISEIFGVSEFFISFFALSIGTSLPELVVAISSIRKRYYELAIGDIIGSCIVDLTITIGLAALVNPLMVNVMEVRLIGSYSILMHFIAISVLVFRRVNDKLSGILLLCLYFSSWLYVFLL